MPDSSPKLTPDVFSVSRRFDMATILVAMLGYAILFGLLRQIPNIWPSVIATLGAFFAVVAIGQAVAIRWNNPRAASVIAGTLHWLALCIIAFAVNELGYSIRFDVMMLLCSLTLFGPISGYLAGTLVGGVFLISHYLRESNGLRRRAPDKDEDADSPLGHHPKFHAPADDYEWPHMIEVPPLDKS